jgi:signal transduction histidine kinase
MFDFINRLLEQEGFMPHGHCYLWQGEVLWLHLIGDGLTVLAYFLIPAMLIYFIRVRRDLRYRTIFYLFGAFIIFCGTSHLISIYTIWEPIYRLESLVKFLTGLVSISTTAYMLVLMPRARRIPTIEQLEAVNQELAEEVDSHKATSEELRASQTELERRLEELKAVNAELERFIYSVSHDLRAPIRHINTHALMLEKSLAESDKEGAQGYLDDLKYTAKRMGGMMDQLLKFSRSRSQALSLQSIDLHEMVAEIKKEEMASTPERSIHWDIDPLPTITGDFLMIRQVFSNLMSNAIKFTSQTQEARVKIATQEQTDQYLIQIQDNGAGFDMRYQKKLFGLFQRLHKQSEFAGFGVGLANAKRVMERHGGSIRGQGVRGEGATFTLTFPKQLPFAAEEAEED